MGCVWRGLCAPATDAQESSPASVDEQDRSVKVHGFPGAALAKCHAVGAQSNRLVCSHSPRGQGPSIQVSAGPSSLRRLQGRVPPASSSTWRLLAFLSLWLPPLPPRDLGASRLLFSSRRWETEPWRREVAAQGPSALGVHPSARNPRLHLSHLCFRPGVPGEHF